MDQKDIINLRPRDTNLLDHHELQINKFTFILFLIVLFLSIFSLTNVKALTERNITSVVTAGEYCTSHPSGSLCTSQIYASGSGNPCGNGDAWCVTYNSVPVNNIVMSLNFYYPSQIEANSANTINLIGTYFANVNYTCNTAGGLSGCSVVRVSSTQLNINFKNTTNNLIYNSQYFIGSSDRGFNNSSNSFRITNIKLLDNPLSNSNNQFDDSGIINNQNQNTSDIIDNNNSNTNAIIDTQKSIYNNTLQTQRSQLENLCKNSYSVSLTKGGLISGTNVVSSATGFYSDYININLRGTPITRVCIQNTYQGNTANQYLIFYDSNKNVLETYYANNACRNVPNGAVYFRIGTNYPGALLTASDYCIKAEDQVYNAMTDDSIENGTGNDFFNNFTTTDNGGISSIVTKPLVLINSFLSNNNSCNNLTFDISIPNTQTTNVSLPSGCILWNNVPSATITIYQTIICGFASYLLVRKLFKDIEDLKNPDDDRVKTEDL